LAKRHRYSIPRQKTNFVSSYSTLLSTIQLEKTMENKKFINHTEAAEYLGISPKTLYAKVSKREIPAYHFKSCRSHKYKISDLDALLIPVR
jgi:excisionase family DNA binding protein